MIVFNKPLTEDCSLYFQRLEYEIRSYDVLIRSLAANNVTKDSAIYRDVLAKYMETSNEKLLAINELAGEEILGKYGASEEYTFTIDFAAREFRVVKYE